MILLSPLSPNKVIAKLENEIDSFPSLLACVLTLNARYFRGTALVCGKICGAEFELRNRDGPGFSLRAKGSIDGHENGAKITIEFRKPIIPDIIGVVLFDRYERDREIIVGFLKRLLQAQGE